MDALLAPLARTLAESLADYREVELVHAYDVAAKAHEGQVRRSGEPYITHPVAVAEILAGLGMDQATICAALLHDTVEDTPYSIEALIAEFGTEIGILVDGVTKLDKLVYGPSAEAETLRKMVVAMSKDIRVLVIKLADRLHNARTWQFVSQESAARKARETIDIYAPLAHRLGMNALKWELEDLSFEVLEPKKFEEIGRLVSERSPERAKFTEEAVQQIVADLEVEKIKATVKGRQKHLYSIFQKMIVRGREFSEIYDLVGIRVIVEDVRDCYAVLGSIHARWSPVPGRFKDYIAMPKFNLYQSLHTTVIGPQGKAVEIQIRTSDMHARAEFGIAAHWKYKLKGHASTIEEPGVVWLKQLHEWQQESEDVSDFLDTLRYDLRTPEVFVFTPKGSVVALPAGSTPVDFAYAVHTEVGNRCVGAKVNGKLIPLDSPLANGDAVDIVTNKHPHAAPSRDWLNFVASPRARSKIKAWFSKERREEAIEAGQESIARQMRKAGLPLQKLLAGQAILELAHELHFPDIESLYASVGNGHVSAASIIEKLATQLKHDELHTDDNVDYLLHKTAPAKRNSSGIDVDGSEDLLVKLARCCSPVPGDEITGFVTKGSGVSVHRVGCLNMNDLQENQADRVVTVRWNAGARSSFLVNIQVEALDRSGLLSDITRTLAEEHVNILNAAVSTSKDRIAISRFTFEMADALHLDSVLSAVRGVAGVYDVYRVTNN
jgi:GTP pyrophosphokinase